MNVFSCAPSSLEKIFEKLPDELIEKGIKALHHVNESRRPSSQVGTQAGSPSSRTKVR